MHKKGGIINTAVLDNKGYSNELPASALIANARRRKPLATYFITTETGKLSHPFNLCLEEFFMALSPQEKADMIGFVTDTEQPGGGDKRFYSDSNAIGLAAVIEANRPRNFHDMTKCLLELINMKSHGSPLPDTIRRTCQHAYTALYRLKDIPCLNGPKTIGLSSAFRRGAILPIRNSVMTGGQTARTVGRLFMWSIVKATNHLGIESGVRTRLFVDELAQMVSPNLDVLYQQARQGGTSLIAAFHNRSDLIKPGYDLAQSVETNSRVRWYFTAAEMESEQRLSRSSSEMVDYLTTETVSDTRSTTSSSSTKGFSEREIILPRLSINDIKRASDHPDLSILHIVRSSGFCQFGGLPFVLRTKHHISKAEYDRRCRMPWPKLPGMEPNVPRATPPPKPPTPPPHAVNEPIETIDDTPHQPKPKAKGKDGKKKRY